MCSHSLSVEAKFGFLITFNTADQENMDQKRRDVLQELNSIRDQVSILLTLMESDGLPCELDKLLEERNLTPSYLQDNYEVDIFLSFSTLFFFFCLY